jgi:hypothetical protein
VSPQETNSNWESETSCYRGLSTRIHRRHLEGYQVPARPPTRNTLAKYGMAVEVADSLSTVNFVLAAKWGAERQSRRLRLKYRLFIATKYTPGWQLNQEPESEE